MEITRRDLLKLGGGALAATAGTAAPWLDPRAAEAQTPKRGGVFHIRGEDPISGLDPYLVVNHHRINTNLSFTHSRLVRVKSGPQVKPGSMPIEPDLAESWTQPNETTYIFKLRKGVRWHNKPPVNGRELTAEDIKYTYERFLSVKGNPNRAMLEQVEKIEALDKYTVKFTTSEPFAWLLDYLATTVMWVVAREVDKAAHSLRGGTPVADLTLYQQHIPGQPLNSSGVNDPKLTEMIRLQRRTFDVAKRREIVYDTQRYLAEQVYYHYDPSVNTVAAWEPYVKNFAPNLGHDYGSRLMVAWLDK